MKIKICGLTREQDIVYANETQPDFIGFVFAPSKRQVSPKHAELLRQKLAPNITPVGVFVDSPLETIFSLFENGVITIAQLHGNEDFFYVNRLKEKKIPIIKTVHCGNLSEYDDFSEKIRRNMSEFYENTDFFLVDSGAGSGKPFDWSVLAQNTPLFSRPWFLAGGICLENCDHAASFRPFGLDISSGAETNGVKDLQKMREFVHKIKMFSSFFL